MNKESIRQTARKYLPKTIRHYVGSFVGLSFQHVVRPVLGLIFDLKGGRFKVDGCEIIVPKDLTTLAYRSCFLMGDYEAEERALIRKYLRPDDSVMELGACIGVVSCVTNRILKKESKHLVVEGNPKLISTIEKNKEHNHAHFTVLNNAVSEEPEVTFYLSEEYIVGGTSQRKSNHPVVVKGASLTALDRENGPFNVILMDVEGSEAEVIPPALELLKNYRMVIWETHDWACGAEATEKCRQTLAQAGLAFVDSCEATEVWVRPLPVGQ